MDINQLVQLAKKGDNTAKDQIYDYFKPIVRAISKSFYIVGGNSDDLIQEGMIGLFFGLDDYDSSKGEFVPFAKLCIRRRIFAAINQANTQKNKALLFAVPLDIEIPSAEASPLEIAVGSDLLHKIKEFIATKLSLTEQDVINLYIDGYNHDEIAEKLGKTYKSVDTALQRGRKKIQNFISQNET